jgi:hypothetical protein
MLATPHEWYLLLAGLQVRTALSVSDRVLFSPEPKMRGNSEKQFSTKYLPIDMNKSN